MDVSRRGKRQSYVTAERSEGAMCKGKDIFFCSCQVYLQTLAATDKTKDNTPTTYFIHVKSFLDVQEAINQITFPLSFRLLCSSRPDVLFSSHKRSHCIKQHCNTFGAALSIFLTEQFSFFFSFFSKKRKATFPGTWRIGPFFSQKGATFWFQNLKSRGQFPC